MGTEASVSQRCRGGIKSEDRIQLDNGSEFISKALDKWAYENKVVLDFSRPGKPTDNANQASYI